MAPSPIAPKVVVLVEPATEERGRLREALEGAGFAVLDFPDYQGALAQAESDRPMDLLITAVRLPAGTPHGVSLAAMTRMRRPRLPVVFIADPADLPLQSEEGMLVMEQPIGTTGLVEIARKLTER